MANSTLRRLLAFDRQVRRDRAQSPVFLHRRDRRFALDCQSREAPPTADRWLAHLERVGRPGAESSHHRPSDPWLRHWRRLLTAFAMIGLVTGAITMTGLLYYDGGQRINLTVLLAFAGLQLLLTLFTLLQSSINRPPWRSLLRRLKLAPPDSPLKSLTPTLMARVAHVGGSCFALAGLATLLVLVVLEDLAFGWSTTLDTAAASYHRLLSALAWPWQSLWPAAVPDLALVEATRFFRAGPDTPLADPSRWGQWWPFVAMVWLVYALLPRLIGLAITQIQLERRARRALANHPGMIALQYRLETPTVDTGNAHHDAEDRPDVQTASRCQALPDSQVLIYWAGAHDPELPDSLTAGHAFTAQAGGQHSLDEDQHTIERAADVLAKHGQPAVTLVTRAWEPPIAELADFIEQAQQAWPSATRLALLPLASDPNQPARADQLGQWLRFAERAGDERLCVSQPDLRSPESRAYANEGAQEAGWNE